MVKYSKYIVMLIFITRIVIIKYNQVYNQILSEFLWIYTFIFRKRLEYINGISPINFWGGSLPLVTAWICGCHLLTYWAHRVQQPEVLSHGLLILIKSAISNQQYRTPLRKEVMLFGHKQLLKSRFSTIQYIKDY